MSDYAFGMNCQLEKKLSKLINVDKLHVSEALEKCALDLHEMVFKMSVVAKLLRNRPVEAKNVFNDEIHYIRLSSNDDICVKILEIATGGNVVDSLNDDIENDDDCGCDDEEECLDCECDDCDGCEACEGCDCDDEDDDEFDDEDFYDDDDEDDEDDEV